MEPPHLQQIRSRDGAIPRYLFRGFNECSGGDRTLNTPSAIIPHAFHDSYVKCVCPDGDERMPPKPYHSCVCGQWDLPHKPIPLANMSRNRLSYELAMHLQTQKYRFASHFTSWTADLKIAMDFAKNKPGGYVGVLDTAQRQSHNMILHVPVLYEFGLINAGDFYSYEYLIYGPVRGTAYTCMDLGPVISARHSPRPGSWAELLVETKLTHFCEEKVCNAILDRLSVSRSLWVQCCEHARGPVSWGSRDCYRLNSPGGNYTWEPLERDMNLFLTVVAAYWSHWCVAIKAKQELNEAIWGLQQIIWKAANDPQVILPLVNPNTYVSGLPELSLMTRLLMRIEAEILKVRNRAEKPWWLFGWSWSQIAGQKRKADDVHLPADTMPGNKRARV